MKVADEVLEMGASYLAPIGGLALGFAFSGMIGGQYSLGQVIWNAIPEKVGAAVTVSTVHAIVGLLFTGIYAGLAMALWHVGSKAQIAGKFIGRFFAGLFGGMAVGSFATGVLNASSPATKGWLDTAVGSN
ncbi:MAG: hypothetical protein ACLP74_01480 [Thermoplasmata archaeon]